MKNMKFLQTAGMKRSANFWQYGLTRKSSYRSSRYCKQWGFRCTPFASYPTYCRLLPRPRPLPKLHQVFPTCMNMSHTKNFLMFAAYMNWYIWTWSWSDSLDMSRVHVWKGPRSHIGCLFLKIIQHGCHLRLPNWYEMIWRVIYEIFTVDFILNIASISTGGLRLLHLELQLHSSSAGQ